MGDQSHKWAKRFCASEGGGARLVTVQSAAEQTALEEYLFRQNAFDLATLEYLWLDGRDVQYDPHLPGNNTYDSSVFRWGQNEKNQKNLSLITFTNWAPGQPVKPLENNATCIQFHADCGKWSNEPCSKANAVVCVQKQRWSPEKVQEVVEKLVKSQKNLATLGFMLEKMQKTIAQLQEDGRQSKETNEKLQRTIEQLERDDRQSRETNEQLQRRIEQLQGVDRQNSETNEKMQKKIEKLTKNPVPLGFIYVQLPKEKSPQEIWPPELQWTDTSSSYESTFFRVAGTKAAPFGAVQEDFSPFIDQVSYENCIYDQTWGTTACQNIFPFEWNTKLDRESPSSWSGRVLTSHRYSSTNSFSTHENNRTTMWTGTLKFHSVGGEVRPKNMAVKVWKRTG